MRLNTFAAGIVVLLGVVATTPLAVCSAQRVPTAEEVIARHAAASGGADALNKHTSIKLSGTVNITPGDLTGTIETLRGRGNRFVEKMVFSTLGVVSRGYDSTVAWVMDPHGPALLTGADADAAEAEGNWYHAFLVPPGLLQARVDSAEYAGEPAWQLTYAAELGMEASAFFSRATGLRLGETRAMPGGDAGTTESAYKDFGGVKLPTVVTNRTRAGSMVITIDSVEFDRVPAAALALPPQVRALIKPH